MMPANTTDNQLICEAYTLHPMKCNVEILLPDDEFEIEKLGTSMGLTFCGRYNDNASAPSDVYDLFTGTREKIERFFTALDSKPSICDYGWPGEPNTD